ncbi:hypothetical protein HYS72_00155 [Candidatus Pacearchaeota archaeon]|nr:hypothetical protein [Candidatus Pacearchaeota archaeon]MBI2057109.1 hypothetical protein [Candidatus Pacearchaeota archaeon]
MTWVKKADLDFVDSKIIKDDFIVAQGSTMAYSFLSKDEKENSFKKSLWAPIFYIFKVHKNHPLKVLLNEGNLRIWSLSDINSSRKEYRFPMEVYKDKLNHDLATFMMVPYDVTNSGWKKYEIPNGFVSIDGKKSDASLLYAGYNTSLHSQDALIVSQVMHSQVLSHLDHWMYEGRKIISHEKTFNQKLEGRVEIPLEIGKNLFSEIAKTLEERYKTKLTFRRN